MHIDVFCIDAFFAHSCIEIDADFAHSSTRNLTSGPNLEQKMGNYGIFKHTNVVSGSKSNIYKFLSDHLSVPLRSEDIYHYLSIHLD